MDFKKVIANVGIAGATGVAAQVLSAAVLKDNPKAMAGIMIGAGALLPELMKGTETETAGVALIAIGANKLADEFNVASSLGIKGLGDTASFNAVNGGRTWIPKQSVKSEAAPKAEKTTTQTVF